MSKNIKYTLQNYVYIFKKYGIIPNGGRTYYLTRTQLPMLIPMVYEYYKVSHNNMFIKQIIDTLDKVKNSYIEKKFNN